MAWCEGQNGSSPVKYQQQQEEDEGDDQHREENNGKPLLPPDHINFSGDYADYTSCPQ